MTSPAALLDPHKTGRVAPWLRRWLEPPVALWTRLMFQPTIEGLDNLPTDRPFLLVGNHSGGIALAELLSFISLYLRATDGQRPLAGFAHYQALRVWPLSVFLRGLGAVPSTYEAAHAALASGIPLLVFPGGDHESFRPVWQADRVDFGGRVGFLRIARDAGVPIVPMGIRGSHVTTPILWQSRHVLPKSLLVPWLLGIKRWPLTAVGLVVGLWLAVGVPELGLWRWPLLWAWLWSPLTMWPVVPSRIRMRVGQPIEPDALFAAGDDLAGPLQQVEAAVRILADAKP